MDLVFLGDSLLFGESQSRVIVSCSPANSQKIEALAKKNHVPVQNIGKTGGDKLTIEKAINLIVKQLDQSWRTALD